MRFVLLAVVFVGLTIAAATYVVRLASASGPAEDVPRSVPVPPSPVGDLDSSEQEEDAP